MIQTQLSISPLSDTHRKYQRERCEFNNLLDIANSYQFESHNIVFDSRGRYDLHLKKEFPFQIKLFHYCSGHITPGNTWHEHLELFLPLDSPVNMQMGDQYVNLEKGDLLIVDNMKLHQVSDLPELDTRVIVISFMPELIYTFGSPSHDYSLILPFYYGSDKKPQILQRSESHAQPVFASIIQILKCYFNSSSMPIHLAGCKAHLLILLYHLAQQFKSTDALALDFPNRQRESLRFKELLKYLSEHYNERITITQAAAMANLSESQFFKQFKKVSGTTFINYVTQLRLRHAHQLLTKSDLSIAEISFQVGFTDQSQFGRKFRKEYGLSPRKLRTSASNY